MNSLLNQKHNNTTFTQSQMDLFIDIIRQNVDAIKILELIKSNTRTEDNINGKGIIKGDLIKELREHYKKNFSKHAANNAINLLDGAGLIYYEENVRGKPYQLTIRGLELDEYMREKK